MRITCCIIFRLILLWTAYKECHFFEIQTAEVCYGNTLSSFINLECGAGEVIQVRNTRAVAKLISTGCPVELTTLNENTVPDNCCTNEPDDCGTIYTGSVYQNYYKRCHGNQNCVSLQASWVDITDTVCNQTEYLPRTNYMIFTYSCIPTSFIKSPCESIQTRNTSVYIWNSGYPGQMAPGADSCTCAAEIDCNATIAIRAIDLRFQDDSNTGLCGQGIVVTDGGSQTELGCASNNEFLETIVYTSKSDFVTIEIKNTLSENGGYFWIEVFGKEEGAQITLSCGPSVISQPEIGDKTVCGTTTTSTTTSTTTTSNTTATSSTITNPATSLTTDNSSNDLANTTSTLTTSISSTESTTSAISSSTESSASSTPISNYATTPFTSTFNSSTNDSTSNVSSSSSSFPATLSSTTPAVSVSEQLTSPRGPQADSVKQTTESGSSSPIGAIVAVVVVLVILFIILVILLCKRKQIKDIVCPNKVEDIKEDDTDLETPEYDTMPNPLLTEGTLPLITGQAAASTDFPSLPGGGYIGKKPTLEPIRSPPKLDGNLVNLSSSLHYKLPKIENIQSSIRRENSSIGDQLVEEHRANPFPNVSHFVTDQGRQSMLGETIEETNGEEGATNSVEMKERKERKMRKKRKRMMDRLNSIRTPMQSRSDSVMGFGSSTTRF